MRQQGLRVGRRMEVDGDEISRYKNSAYTRNHTGSAALKEPFLSILTHSTVLRGFTLTGSGSDSPPGPGLPPRPGSSTQMAQGTSINVTLLQPLPAPPARNADQPASTETMRWTATVSSVSRTTSRSRTRPGSTAMTLTCRS